MKNYAEELGNFLEEYVVSHSVSFLREKPRDFASIVFRTFSLLSFPSTEDNFEEGLKAKVLYSLWNAVLDDTIEYTDEGKDNVLDSLYVLIRSKKEKNFKGRTRSGYIMHDFIREFCNLPSGRNRNISEEMIFLDLIKIINGFDYERITQQNRNISSLSEYIEFGAITIDIRVLLDIDIATYPHALNPLTIRNLREAYEWFSLAFRMSSDIATFEREYFIEKSNNAVILHGQEKGVLSRDILDAERRYKEKQLESVIPSLMNDIEEMGRTYLSKSIECLGKVTEIDTYTLSKGFTEIFENYPGQRTFSPPVVKVIL